MSLADGAVRLAVIVIDGLPCELLDRAYPELPFLSSRTPHRSTAVSCFPSTTGPAYFPLLAGVTPGRANVTGIRWFDRTRPTRSRFPHRGLRSYVGPDAGKLASDTKATTLYERHAWPASTPVNKDSPKGREKSRDVLWVWAHFTHRWEIADRRTAWKLGRALAKERPIVFAVFPSVDEFGHTKGFEGDEPYRALIEIDGLLAEKLGDFDGEILVTADHGLTATSSHIDLRAVVEEEVGSTIAFPLTGKPDPEAVVCESATRWRTSTYGARQRGASCPRRRGRAGSRRRCSRSRGSTPSGSGEARRRLRSCTPATAWARSGSATAASTNTAMRSQGASNG
jgi:Type I phosphodiesterase / nucleotide pyrophosphatase